MIIWILIIAVLCLWKASFCKSGITEYYISRDGTNAVRGIFILLILASHFIPYVSVLTQPLDTCYLRIRTFLGQFVVTMFLFYSGYGVTLSFEEKGEQYKRTFLVKRVLHTLLIFDLSIPFYFTVQASLGNKYTLGEYFLSMLAWKNLGNSNWYIFVILVLYFISWVAAKVCNHRNALQNVFIHSVGIFVFTQLLMCANKESWWYNTLFCYPLGVVFYYLRKHVEQFLSKSGSYYLCFLITAGVFFLIHKIWKFHLFFYEMDALLFTILVILITMKLEIRNLFLRSAGKYLNELYLTHRIPMILLGQIPYIKERVHLYFVLSVFSAVLCAILFRRFVDLLYGKTSSLLILKISETASCSKN